MIDPGYKRLSIVRQCELVSISRASFYRRPASESEENLKLMRLIDEAFLETPWYGARQMARHLRRLGWCIGRKRVRRLMRKIGLAPIYQAPKTSVRRQDARRGLCYRTASGETGGVIEPRIHLSQAANLSRKADPPLSRAVQTLCTDVR